MEHRHEARREATHYLIRALLLAGFALYIVYLVRMDALILYIAPRMQWLVKLAALGLYGVAAHQLYAAIRAWADGRRHAADCSCGHDHELPRSAWRSALLYGWFALPLLLGFALPDGVLGSKMAEAKGIQFAPKPAGAAVQRAAASPAGSPAADVSPSAAPATEAAEGAGASPSSESDAGPAPSLSASSVTANEDEALDALFPSDPFTELYAAYGKQLYRQDVVDVTEQRFIETLTTLDLYRDAFWGKTVRVSGFVYREEEMSPDQFAIGRFAISCCTADAAPYGVMASYGRASTLATDDWVRITGTLEKTSYNGIEIMQLQVTKVEPIEPSEEPYVYPDMDFGLE